MKLFLYLSNKYKNIIFKMELKIGDTVRVLRKRDWNSKTGDICKIVNTYNDCDADMIKCKTVYLCVRVNDDRHNEMAFYENELVKI